MFGAKGEIGNRVPPPSELIENFLKTSVTYVGGSILFLVRLCLYKRPFSLLNLITTGFDF